MTTSLETLCRQVEQESAAATAGPWYADENSTRFVWLHPPGVPSDDIIKVYTKRSHRDQRFIATARDFAPKAARALLVTKTALEKLANMPTSDISSGNQLNMSRIAREALASILSEFEQPKENA